MTKIYRHEDKHGEHQQDLAPDANKGLNWGQAGPQLKTEVASNLKEMHEVLSDFTMEELKQIPVQCAGNRLETDAMYLRLASGGQRFEVKAMGDEDVAEGEVWIAKKDVPFELWNRLIGVDDPQRTKRMPR